MWEASAPSNIALIKYMGKKPAGTAGGNVPMNSSLSWTLDNLRSFVQIEQNNSAEDRWEPHPQFPETQLTETGRAKFLNHFQLLKKNFGLESHFFTIRSGNNFPSDCGIASSASSFAALTIGGIKALESFHATKKMDTSEMAQLSRQGSGSSCRSFYPGWVTWTETEVAPLESRLNSLIHMVVMVSDGVKKVSSSKAHEMVKTSALLRGRAERAQERYNRLTAAITASPVQWKTMYELSWADFWDMHALFETSEPAFGYMTAESLEVTNKARALWEQTGDGPIVTMDAGPNVHLLWRPDQKVAAQEFKKEISNFKILSTLGDG
jgi:diphosphomevalonate decarboxylase